MTPNKMTPTERALSVINHYNLQIKSSEDVHKVLIELSQELERAQSRLTEEYSKGVTAGKLEACNYTPEERERYGKWAAEGLEWSHIKQERDQLRAQLSDTIARHNEQIRLMCAGKDKYENDNVQLRAQVAKLQKDKERLDWLESNVDKLNLQCDLAAALPFWFVASNRAMELLGAAHKFSGLNLRLALNAAMKETK